MMMDITKFDPKKMPIQAQVVLAVGIGSMLVMASQSFMEKGPKLDIAAVIGALIGVAIATYNVRCLVRGNCNRWASIVAISYVLAMALSLMANSNRK